MQFKSHHSISKLTKGAIKYVGFFTKSVAKVSLQQWSKAEVEISNFWK